jgi:phage terminase small subunit
MSEPKFTPRQRKFIEAYKGNATEAAKLAGYSGDENTLGVTGYELLRNPKIALAIREREEKRITGLIATRQERQEYWTLVMTDPNADEKDKLRASELLGKSEGDFIEKIEHHDKFSGLTDEQIDALIEAKLNERKKEIESK